MISAALAVPGDITIAIGGYIYNRRLPKEVRLAGREMRLTRLAFSFPFSGNALAQAATRFGSRLPDWAETVRIAGVAVDAAARAPQ